MLGGRGHGAGGATVDEVLQNRVVGGELLRASVAHEIGSAVADVGDVQLTVEQDGHRGGRAHADELGGLGGAGANPIVRDADGVEETTPDAN